VRDRDRHAALRRAVEFRQHDPVDAGHARELTRLRQPILADRGIQHEQNLVRSPRDLARRNPPYLVQFVHQIHARMKPPGRVDENRIAPLRQARRDGVVHHGGRIRAFSRANDSDTGARRPDFQLLNGRRTKCIGGTDERCPALALQEFRELADGRRLPRPVHADDQRHRGVSCRRWLIDGLEYGVSRA
jgi:hypothetical protein